MAESKYRVIGSIKQGNSKNTLGYALVDLTTNQAVFRSIEELVVLTRNGMTFQNVVIDANTGECKGTDGSINRLPVFSTDGKALGKPTVTVLGEYKNGETSTGYYKVMDTYGRTKDCSKAKLLSYLGKMDGTNAKLVMRGSTPIVSAIVGSFAVIQVPTKGKPLATGEIEAKVFMKQPSGASVEEALVRNKKTLADASIEITSTYPKTVRDILGQGEKSFNVDLLQKILRWDKQVKEIEDVVGDVFTEYVQLIDLRDYVEVGLLRPVRSAKRIVLKREEAVSKWYALENKKVEEAYAEYQEFRVRCDHTSCLRYTTLCERRASDECLSQHELWYYSQIEAGRVHDEIIKSMDLHTVSLLATYNNMYSMVRAGLHASRDAQKVPKSAKLLDPSDVAHSEVPALREFLLRSKIEYTWSILCKDKELLSLFDTMQEFRESLSVLFIIAVRRDFASSRGATPYKEWGLGVLSDFLELNRRFLREPIKLLSKYI